MGKPQTQSPAPASSPNLQAAAVAPSPQNPSAPTASAAAQGANSTDTQAASGAVAAATAEPGSSSTGKSSSPVSTQFAWLEAIFPAAGIIQKLASRAGAAASSGGEGAAAKVAASASQAGNTTASQASGIEPAGVASLPAAASTAAANAITAALPVSSTPEVANQSSQLPLADPSPAGDGTEGRSSTAAPAPGKEIASSFERIGVSVLSVSASARAAGAPKGLDGAVGRASQPGPQHTSGTASASATSHLSNSPADGTAQPAARDSGLANANQAQPASSHSPSSTNDASSDASKNGASQDSGGKSQNGPQTGSGANPSAAASAAANPATQAASTGFAATLAQAGQPTGAGSHSATPAQAAGTPPTTSSKVAAAMDTAANVPTGIVSSASMLQAQGKTEMRVALQTDAMGTLQLHAVLDNGKLGASIAVVSHEAHTLLTSELPALQQVLTDQNLRVDRLSVINSPMTAFGGGSGTGSGSHSGDADQTANAMPRWVGSAPLAASGGKEIPVQEEVRRRLSVRA